MNLAEIRKKSGLSQSALSDRSGVNLRAIQNYEMGRRSLNGGTSLDNLVRLAEALEVPFWELIDDHVLRKLIRTNVKRGL